MLCIIPRNALLLSLLQRRRDLHMGNGGVGAGSQELPTRAGPRWGCCTPLSPPALVQRQKGWLTRVGVPPARTSVGLSSGPPTLSAPILRIWKLAAYGLRPGSLDPVLLGFSALATGRVWGASVKQAGSQAEAASKPPRGSESEGLGRVPVLCLSSMFTGAAAAGGGAGRAC